MIRLLITISIFSGFAFASDEHLVPVNPLSEYERYVNEKLLGAERRLYGLVERPSFEAENAVYATADFINDDQGELIYNEHDLPKAKAWFLESVVASENIWYGEYSSKEKSQKKISVSRSRVTITEQQFWGLQRALYSALAETRYSNEPTYIADGTRYTIFSSGRFGSMHSPMAEGKTPYKLTQLYISLKNYIESSGKNKESLEYIAGFISEYDNGHHNQ